MENITTSGCIDCGGITDEAQRDKVIKGYPIYPCECKDERAICDSDCGRYAIEGDVLCAFCKKEGTRATSDICGLCREAGARICGICITLEALR